MFIHLPLHIKHVSIFQSFTVEETNQQVSDAPYNVANDNNRMNKNEQKSDAEETQPMDKESETKSYQKQEKRNISQTLSQTDEDKQVWSVSGRTIFPTH